MKHAGRRAALILLLASSLPARAQGPSADWRTLTTRHFRVHYPAASEAWTRRAAARLESIRERVIAEVGYAPPEVVDVVVSDPIADANGSAFPILGWPRMIVWTSPPGPESDLGHYSDWSDLLIVHEEAHLVHLLRPSRNPLRERLAKVAPVGPISLAAPRWVMEGYATVIEGRLTASGRPNGDLRASILRRWAQAGKLPTYAQLNSDRRSWHGMSMAYLLGSAYLEWLEARGGPGSLRNLWARMAARTPRGFDDAFRGVFGEAPADLYDRFRAELTWRGIEAERRLGSATREGSLWQDLSWTVGAPAISPDGKELVIQLDRRDEPSRLVIWSTASDEDEEKKRQETIKAIRERDPEDIPAVLTKPPGRKPLHVLPARDGITATTPRWLADGKAILCVRFEPDPQGFLHPDLFRWTPESGDLQRLTWQANLRDPDPSPVAEDPGWAVAVRNRDGASAVVRVDLKTGAVSDLVGPSLEEVYDRPRISPDGRRVVFARHREGTWRLVIHDLASGTDTDIAPPSGGTVSSPAWSPDGRTLYAVVGHGGFIDLWAFSAEDPSQPPVRLTRTQGAAFSPAPTPDGTAVFFLSLEYDGPDLRRLDLPAGKLGGSGGEELTADLSPAVRPASPSPQPPFATADVPPGHPYDLGRQELLPILGGSVSPAGSVVELGVRTGDVVGRLEVLAVGALASDGWPQGGALAGVWRGWPIAVGLHLFQSREEPSEQNGPLASALRSLDLERRGAELSAAWERRWSSSRLSLLGGALWEDVDPAAGPDLRREVGSLTGTWSFLRRWEDWKLVGLFAAHGEWGQTGDDAWDRWGGSAHFSLDRKDTGLSLSWRRDTASGTLPATDFYQLGGAQTSLLPRTATAGLIAVPGLPFGTLTGTDHEGQRAELRLSSLPAPLFYERHRLWQDGGVQGGWLSLAGMEWRGSVGPLPIVRVPALDFRIGIARVIEEPFPLEVLDGDIRWWVTAVWRP